MAWVVPNGCYYAAVKNVWNYYNENTTVNTEHDPTANYVTFVLVDFANGYIYANATNIIIQLTENNTFLIPESVVGMVAPAQFYASIDSVNRSRHISLDGNFSFGNGSGILDAEDFLQSGLQYDMSNSFINRTDLISVSIPSGVRSLTGAFFGCTSLTSVSDITITTGMDLSGTFSGCTSLTTAPAIPSDVINVRRCFKGCSSLVTAPTIPVGVKNAESCFEDCTSLTGPITIDASPTNITNMFAGTVQDIILFGTGGLNETLVSEYANLYYWSLSATITAQREEQTQTTVDVSVNVSRFSSGTLSSLNLYRDSDTTPLSVTWNDPTLTITGTNATFTTSLSSIGESDTFTLTVVATDSYGSSQASSIKIPIAFFTMDVQAGGKEIAFGGLADDDVTQHPNGLFKCSMDAIFVSMVGEIKMWAGNTVPTGWLECDGSAVSRTTYPMLFSAIGTLWGAGDGSTTFNLPNLQGRTSVGASSSTFEWVTIIGEGGGTFVIDSPTYARFGDPVTDAWVYATIDAGTYTATYASLVPSVFPSDPASGIAKILQVQLNVGSTAGTSEQYLTVAEMPSHNHTQNSHGHSVSNIGYFLYNQSEVNRLTVASGSGRSNMLHSDGATSRPGGSAVENTATNNATGGGKIHSQMQPFAVVKYIICAA